MERLAAAPPAWAAKPAESAALRREYCCQREALCGALEAEGASLLRYANGVLGAYCAAQGKARWVHKHPSDVHSVGALLGAFPGASVLYVVRDGRDVACSLAERLGSFKSGVERWARDNAAMRPWWAHPAVLTVRYESLVTEPRATLEGCSTTSARRGTAPSSAIRSGRKSTAATAPKRSSRRRRRTPSGRRRAPPTTNAASGR